MAAGQGFKTFTTGEVLTAGDVNGYLMQGINVFASEAARDAAITAPAEGQFAFTKDNNSLWYYTGSAWAASGATGDIEGVTAGVGISGGGTSGTVTITNDMATTITASGDIVVGTGSGTYDNLPIGTTGQVLTADTTVSPYKVKWAAAGGASGALTKVSTTTFSNVATQDIDSVFTSSYNSYLIVMSSVYASTAADDLHLQMRVSSTTATDTYYGAIDGISYSGTSSITGTNNGTEALLTKACGHSSFPSSFSFYMIFPNGGGSSGRSRFFGQTYDSDNAVFYNFGYARETAAVYTGFRLKSSSSNISGTVVVYGLEK